MKVLPVLVRLAQRGHPYAVNSLLSILGERAERSVLRATKDANLADECSQATCIAMWRRLHALDASRNVGGYALLTAKHEVAHASRRQPKTTSLDDLLEDEEGNYEPAGREPSPLDSLIHEEEQRRQNKLFGDKAAPLDSRRAVLGLVFAGSASLEPEFERCPADQASLSEHLPAIRAWLAELPNDKRSLFRLRFVELLRPKEIAARLAKPPGTIRAKLTRMLQSIRKKLGLPLRASEIEHVCSQTRMVA